MRVTNSTLLALLVLSVGCSADIKRLSVSGTVSIDGKPIENCLLVFQSKDGGSNLGSTAIVSRGEFSLKDEVSWRTNLTWKSMKNAKQRIPERR